MPFTSQASHKYLQVFSQHSHPTFPVLLHVHKSCQARLRLSYHQAGPSCPSTKRRYATAASQVKPKSPAQDPSKTKPPPKKTPTPKISPRLSASSLKTVLRSSLTQHQEKQKASKEKKYDGDPVAAAAVMRNAVKRQPGIDVWAYTETQTLDVALPVRNELPKGLNAIKYFFDNVWNISKSGFSVYQIAREKAIPPLYSVPNFPYDTRTRPPASPAPDQVKLYKPSHLYHMATFSSTSPTAWLAGIPGLSLHLYMQMCKAIAENDRAALKRVTSGAQQEHALHVIANRDPDMVCSWKFVRENSPTRIVSIRTARMYDSKQNPQPGLNRMLMNALVRFDTTQSLEISTKSKSKEPRGATASISANSIDGKVTQKRVLEYYIIQKKGWVPAPWTIRERIYDTSGSPEKSDGIGNGNEAEGGNSVVGGPNGFMTYLQQRLSRR